MHVNILKNWDWPDLIRQTPGNSGKWGEIHFAEGYCEGADYVIVLNGVRERTRVKCSPEKIWAIMQEPPVGQSALWHRGNNAFARIYTTDPNLKGGRFIVSQAALPWHVNKTYDELKSAAPPAKPRKLSWITSNADALAGHRDRMKFLAVLRKKLDFDLFGRGFNLINDKWNALAPYRYSLAVENFSNPFYWTEKIADCFLAWTMPIYYGCTEINRFFSPESLIQIDINDLNAPEIIREAIETDRWMKNRDAIAYARELVLKKYNLFPFMACEIMNHRKKHNLISAPCLITIPAIDEMSWGQRVHSLRHAFSRGIDRFRKSISK